MVNDASIKYGSLLNCVRSELNVTPKISEEIRNGLQTHLIRGLSVFSLQLGSMIDKYCMTHTVRVILYHVIMISARLNFCCSYHTKC